MKIRTQVTRFPTTEAGIRARLHHLTKLNNVLTDHRNTVHTEMEGLNTTISVLTKHEIPIPLPLSNALGNLRQEAATLAEAITDAANERDELKRRLKNIIHQDICDIAAGLL